MNGLSAEQKQRIAKRRENDKQSAKECYDKLKVCGRRTCGGCDYDYVCQMSKDVSQWLVIEFLPAIDPSGQLFGHPKEEL